MKLKDNIRRTTDEARKDIPRYTQAVNEYQEETIQEPDRWQITT